jgi:hypothetical protein
MIAVGFTIGIIFLPDECAQAPKQVGISHRLYVYRRHCAFSWY